MIEFRPYQEHAIRSARSKIASGIRRILLNAPTGAGKTCIAAGIVLMAVAKGKRVLFLAHRRELIDQTVEKLVSAGVLNFGVIMAGKPLHNWNAPAQVASIQTLIKRELPPADIVMIDEAHRSQSRSYLSVLANYPDAVVIGLTATPERLDGKGLDDIFDDMVVVETIPNLIKNGYLIQPICYGGKTADLSGVRTRRGDYDESQLAEAMDDPKLVGDIIANWRRYASTRQTVAFAVTVEHAEHIAAEFRAAGVSAAALSGSTPKQQREAILADWRAGHIQVVSNCMILTEGFDYPELSACILARPTQSLSLYLQMVGRILRTAHGKDSAVILDHAGCYMEHGPAHIDREWTLEGLRERKKREIDVLECTECALQYQPEPKLFLAETQESLRESFNHRAMELLQGPIKGRGMSSCPSCGQAQCLMCMKPFKPHPVRTDIDGIAHQMFAQCPTCGARYSDDVPHIITEREESGPPTTTDDFLERIDDSEIPIKVTVLNDYKKLINEARQKGRKRGWAWYRLKEKYDESTLRECLPRHRADWWRAQA